MSGARHDTSWKKFICQTLTIALLIFSQYSLSAQEFSRADSLRGNLSPLRKCYDVKKYDLEVRFNFENKSISGSNNVTILGVSNFKRIQMDLFKNMILDSVKFLGKKIQWEREENAVYIDFKDTIKQGRRIEFFIYYHGKPAIASNPPWDGGLIWSSDSLGRPWVSVACEGIGASLWWPNKDHLSDEPDSIVTTFHVPRDLKCVSNGILANTFSRDSTTSYQWLTTYPINNYNVTFNIAYYENWIDSVRLPSGLLLPLQFYTLDYHVNQAKVHFRQIGNILNIFSGLFGDYPFSRDHFKIVETSYLGMEHQSCISYGNQFKNDVLGYDFILLHETAHEWWGNSISAKDHGELWIHEAFATYAETLFFEKIYGREKSLEYIKYQKKLIKNKKPISGPLDVNFNSWGDSDMYYKGAWMLHTLRNIINNDVLWFGLLKDLHQEFKLSNVTSTDIIHFINTRTSTDFSSFFVTYLKSAQPPVLQYYLKKLKGKVLLFYRWKNTTPEFSFPIEVNLDADVRTIKPSQEWQSLPLITFPKEIAFPLHLYYLHIENSK